MNDINPLQAALEAANKDNIKAPVHKKKASIKNKKTDKVLKKSSRENTVLIGGHFSKKVSKQLKFIAVEEDMTNQQLLEEALDLLFLKKGKKRVAEL